MVEDLVKLGREFRAESCVVENFQVDTGRLVHGSLELKLLKLFSFRREQAVDCFQLIQGFSILILLVFGNL